MATRRVTVFGGTGYLGRRIVQRLAADGWSVRVAARRIGTGALAVGEGVRADITERESVARAVADADAVINAVSLYSERGGQTFAAVHVEAARQLAQVAYAGGTRTLVHVSGIGADSDSPSRYVAARGRGELAVREAFPMAVLLRPSVLFGPDDAFLSTLDAVTRLPLVPLFGSGNTRLQPVHVDDVAAAAARVLADATDPPAPVLELGGPEVLSYRRIVEMVLVRHGRRRLLLPVPFAVWHALAALARPLPRPPLTRDQVILMQQDNVVAAGAAGFASLGIEPQALSEHLAAALLD